MRPGLSWRGYGGYSSPAPTASSVPTLARALLGQGYEVGILSRPTSDLSRIQDLAGVISSHSADLRDPASVQRVVEEARPDAIIHLATYYAVEHRPEEVGVMMDTNVKGTIALLEASRNRGISLFLNMSTCAVYRERNSPLEEMDPVSPQNLYALTKLQAEDACRFYNDRLGVPAASLRLFPPYGPADNDRRLIPYVIRSLLARPGCQAHHRGTEVGLRVRGRCCGGGPCGTQEAREYGFSRDIEHRNR